MSNSFLREIEVPALPWASGVGPSISFEVDRERLVALRRGSLPDLADLRAAADLLDLVYDDLHAFGTGGGETCTNNDMRAAIPALAAVMSRVGLPLELPFRDFDSFKTYWNRKGCHGSWQARRELIDDLMLARMDEVRDRQDRASAGELVDPITPRADLGWPSVDTEIKAMRDEFVTATTPQNCRAVGLHATGVLETLSAVAYVHELHGGDDDEPPVSNTKDRLERVIDVELAGSGKRELRQLAKAAIVAAQRVKHGGTPNRTDAGIAADATLLVANIIRRLRDERTE